MQNTIVDERTIDINVHHLTRIEGHSNLRIEMHNGMIEQCKLEVIESPRFFEFMMRGKPYQYVPLIASRICGICAVSHATTSLCAIEAALGVQVSPQTLNIRKLNMYAEMIDSHILHIFMLVAPDLFGLGSVLPMSISEPQIVSMALRMKKLAGDICKVLCGRHTHPISLAVGGFTRLPAVHELEKLYDRLDKTRIDIENTVELFKGLKLPDFYRETEYIALQQAMEYSFIDGDIASSEGVLWPKEDYKKVTNEFQVNYSNAKHARHRYSSYMVGALARFNLNHHNLHPNAQKVAKALNLLAICHNPFMNTIAQLVEVVHCYEEAQILLRNLLASGINLEQPVQPSRFTGEGIGACEAPRGTLYHHYVIQNGYISDANCVIPTAQNLANIEADMKAFVPTIIDKTNKEIQFDLEMLVRAYDPCISCSVH